MGYKREHVRLPISMCAPFAADYDEDEMTLFAMKESESILECQTFKWSYGQSSPHNKDFNKMVVPFSTAKIPNPSAHQAMCTTVTWSDRRRGMAITNCHEKRLTSRSHFFSLNKSHKDLDDFMNTSIRLVTSTCSKSSAQSDVGCFAVLLYLYLLIIVELLLRLDFFYQNFRNQIHFQ